MFSILAISGSLRSRSSNSAVLDAAALLASPSATFTMDRSIGELPHFNPDLDGEGADLPSSVRQLRHAIASHDALIISSPEYAHGVPGSLKNALDWLVSGPEMVNKPVGLLTASSRSVYAHEQLAETLRTMSTAIIPATTVVVPLDGRRLDAAAIAADPALAAIIREAIDALRRVGAGGVS